MAIPSRTYFPLSLQERAAWYKNFSEQATATGTTLGLTALEVTQIADDYQVLDFLAAAAISIENYAEAVRQYRKIITEGKIGEPTPAFPANLALTLPVVTEAGMFERLIDYVDRIRASAAYTDEVGAAYGILPQSNEEAPAGPPAIKATVEPGNVVNVKFVRGSTDGVRIEASIDKGAWVSQGNFFKSPAQIIVPQNADQLPRQVSLRARHLEGNNPFGDWSDVVTVQTIP